VPTLANGALDGVELEQLLHRLMPGTSLGDVRLVQMLLDADGDGSVTYDELVASLRACRDQGLVIGGQDRGENGVLDAVLVGLALFLTSSCSQNTRFS
jgi:hypothetical protein